MAKSIQFDDLDYQTVYFEDLSIAEILAYFGTTFCEAKDKYLRYGKNLRAAWEVLWENESEYDSVCGHLGLETDTRSAYKNLAKAMQAHLDKDVVTYKEILHNITAHIPEEWLMTHVGEDKEAIEKEWKVFSSALFEYLEKQFKIHKSTWKMILVRRPATKTKKKGK